MLALAKSESGVGGMEVVGCGDVDDVEIRITDELFVGAVRAGEGERLGEVLGSGARTGADRLDAVTVEE